MLMDLHRMYIFIVIQTITHTCSRTEIDVVTVSNLSSNGGFECEIGASAPRTLSANYI